MPGVWTPEMRARMAALVKARGSTLTDEGRARKAQAMVGNSHALGHRHSPEVRARIAASHRGVTRVFHDPETMRSRQSTAARRRGIPVEQRARIWRSLNTRREWLDGRGRLWRFRSKWELRFAEHLDRQGLAWSYEPHKLLLSDGTTYTPDFWIEEWATYAEVKGWSRWGKEKIELAQRDGHAVRVFGRADLIALGVKVYGSA